MSSRGKRKAAAAEAAKFLNQKVVCTACTTVMLRSQMMEHDQDPTHRRNVTTLRIDRAIMKAGFGQICTNNRLSFV